MSMQTILRPILVAASLALLTSTAAQANDCEAKAHRVAVELGATIDRERNPPTIFLKYGALPDVTIGCDAAGTTTEHADINFFWGTENPSKSFWSFVGEAGSIITGAPPKEVKRGARACFDAASRMAASREDGGGEYDLIHGVYMNCVLTKKHGGTFAVSMYRRDAGQE
jgi:hypothetical protein